MNITSIYHNNNSSIRSIILISRKCQLYYVVPGNTSCLLGHSSACMMHTTPSRKIGTVIIECCCMKSAYISVQIDMHVFHWYQIPGVIHSRRVSHKPYILIGVLLIDPSSHTACF